MDYLLVLLFVAIVVAAYLWYRSTNIKKAEHQLSAAETDEEHTQAMMKLAAANPELGLDPELARIGRYERSLIH